MASRFEILTVFIISLMYLGDSFILKSTRFPVKQAQTESPPEESETTTDAYASSEEPVESNPVPQKYGASGRYGLPHLQSKQPLKPKQRQLDDSYEEEDNSVTEVSTEETSEGINDNTYNKQTPPAYNKLTKKGAPAVAAVKAKGQKEEESQEESEEETEEQVDTYDKQSTPASIKLPKTKAKKGTPTIAPFKVKGQKEEESQEQSEEETEEEQVDTYDKQSAPASIKLTKTKAKKGMPTVAPFKVKGQKEEESQEESDEKTEEQVNETEEAEEEQDESVEQYQKPPKPITAKLEKPNLKKGPKPKRVNSFPRLPVTQTEKHALTSTPNTETVDDYEDYIETTTVLSSLTHKRKNKQPYNNQKINSKLPLKPLDKVEATTEQVSSKPIWSHMPYRVPQVPTRN